MKPVEAMALISGNVEEEVPLRNEYLALENAILRSKLVNIVWIVRYGNPIKTGVWFSG